MLFIIKVFIILSYYPTNLTAFLEIFLYLKNKDFVEHM